MANCQWRVEEELGDHWSDSSFFKALCGETTRGTVSVLDPLATPYTRSWCLFEVAQTLERIRADESYRFMICTPTGTINSGRASIDSVITLGQRVVTLDF